MVNIDVVWETYNQRIISNIALVICEYYVSFAFTNIVHYPLLMDFMKAGYLFRPIEQLFLDAFLNLEYKFVVICSQRTDSRSDMISYAT